MARRFHRVRHHAGRAMSGAKGSLIGVASGAGTAALSGIAQTAVPFLSQGGWWAMPAALAIAGHFLKRKNPTIGGAILGIAGYQAYANFIGAKSAKGFADAGAYASFADAGVLVGEPGAVQYTDSARTSGNYGTGSGQNAGMLMNKEVMGWGDAGELVGEAMGLES